MHWGNNSMILLDKVVSSFLFGVIREDIFNKKNRRKIFKAIDI